MPCACEAVEMSVGDVVTAERAWQVAGPSDRNTDTWRCAASHPQWQRPAQPQVVLVVVPGSSSKKKLKLGYIIVHSKA